MNPLPIRSVFVVNKGVDGNGCLPNGFRGQPCAPNQGWGWVSELNILSSFWVWRPGEEQKICNIPEFFATKNGHGVVVVDWVIVYDGESVKLAWF